MWQQYVLIGYAVGVVMMFISMVRAQIIWKLEFVEHLAELMKPDLVEVDIPLIELSTIWIPLMWPTWMRRVPLFESGNDIREAAREEAKYVFEQNT